MAIIIAWQRWSLCEELHHQLQTFDDHNEKNYHKFDRPEPYHGKCPGYCPFRPRIGPLLSTKLLFRDYFNRFDPALVRYRHESLAKLLQSVATRKELWDVPIVRTVFQLDALKAKLAEHARAQAAAVASAPC